MKNIGDEILKEIIREGLVTAECRDVCVWAANAAEVLEAICMRHAQALMFRHPPELNQWEGNFE